MFVIGWNDGHTLTGAGTGALGIIKETDRNRSIGAKARKILSEEYEKVKIIDCTINKSNDDMYQAVKKANDNKCDLFVSNHVNAGGGVGFETFYSRKSTQSNINKAKIIHKHLVDTRSCLMNRRCCDDFSYKGYDFYVLVNTVMDAVLCEIGFVDNASCVQAIDDNEVARAYAEGIAEAYGLKKKQKEVGKVKGIVIYTNDIDRRAAEYLADDLGLPTIHANTKFDYKTVNQSGIYAVGGNAKQYTSYLLPQNLVSGPDRYETVKAVLKKINRL